MNLTSRKPSGLTDSLHQRLNMYALAASAAGVGVLALAPRAEAKIVYTKAHVKIETNKPFNLDLNHDGITDFRLLNSNNGTSGDLAVGVPAYNVVWEQSKSQFHRQFAAAARAGDQIGVGSNQFISSGPRFYMADVNDAGSGGPWKDVHNRYLGLSFTIKGKTHFGWAGLNVTIANREVSAVLTGYAYETVERKSIVAGKTKGLDAITLEPGSLGALAAGALKAHQVEK
jgi:hypothetical protein